MRVYVRVCVGEEEWSADLAGIWESRPRPDRRGMCGSQPAYFAFMSEISVTPPECTLTASPLMHYTFAACLQSTANKAQCRCFLVVIIAAAPIGISLHP